MHNAAADRRDPHCFVTDAALDALNLNFGDWIASDEAGRWRPRA
jgi:hypothetical protein